MIHFTQWVARYFFSGMAGFDETSIVYDDLPGIGSLIGVGLVFHLLLTGRRLLLKWLLVVMNSGFVKSDYICWLLTQVHDFLDLAWRR